MSCVSSSSSSASEDGEDFFRLHHRRLMHGRRSSVPRTCSPGRCVDDDTHDGDTDATITTYSLSHITGSSSNDNTLKAIASKVITIPLSDDSTQDNYHQTAGAVTEHKYRLPPLKYLFIDTKNIKNTKQGPDNNSLQEWVWGEKNQIEDAIEQKSDDSHQQDHIVPPPTITRVSSLNHNWNDFICPSPSRTRHFSQEDTFSSAVSDLAFAEHHQSRKQNQKPRNSRMQPKVLPPGFAVPTANCYQPLAENQQHTSVILFGDDSQLPARQQSTSKENQKPRNSRTQPKVLPPGFAVPIANCYQPLAENQQHTLFGEDSQWPARQQSTSKENQKPRNSRMLAKPKVLTPRFVVSTNCYQPLAENHQQEVKGKNQQQPRNSHTSVLHYNFDDSQETSSEISHEHNELLFHNSTKAFSTKIGKLSKMRFGNNNEINHVSSSAAWKQKRKVVSSNSIGTKQLTQKDSPSASEITQPLLSSPRREEQSPLNDQRLQISLAEKTFLTKARRFLRSQSN